MRAAAVASGTADCGMGVRQAADADNTAAVVPMAASTSEVQGLSVELGSQVQAGQLLARLAEAEA